VLLFGLVAAFARPARGDWRTIGWGIGLQLALAMLVLWVPASRQRSSR